MRILRGRKRLVRILISNNLRLDLNFREYISEVIVGSDIGPTELMREMGIDQMTTVAKWYRDETYPRDNYIKIICDRYDYDPVPFKTWCILKKSPTDVIEWLDTYFIHRSEK